MNDTRPDPEALLRAAAAAGVSHHTARAFELDPESIRDRKRRQRLVTVYARLRREAEASAQGTSNEGTNG